MIAAATLAGLVWAAAPPGAAAREPARPDERVRGAARAKRHYRGPGLRAFKAGHHAWELRDWETTLTRMTEALNADADQPEAQVNIGGCGWLSPYIPKYYQSLAQCKLGQCGEAKRDTDEVLKLIKDAPGYLRRRYQSDCQKACLLSAP